MPALLETAGAQPRNQSRGKPIHVARMETGLFTNRSALHDPAQFVISKFYGGYVDALIDGGNMEVSNALTLIRRPGMTPYSNQNIPEAPNWFYDWRKLDTTISVVVDTPLKTYILTPTTIQTIFTKSAGAGQGYYQGIGNVLYYGDGVDLQKFDGTNTWNWGIAAPASAPVLQTIAAGSASSVWVLSTVFSTMGLIVDSNGNVQQLNSVNALGTNTTQLGTTGNGNPAWNQTAGGTTPDNAHNWTNKGPIVLRQPSTTYNNGSGSGVGNNVNPCIVYDPVTKCCFINATPGNANGTTGSGSFAFGGGIGWNGWDGTVKWFNLGSLKTPPAWAPNHTYPNLGSVQNDDSVCGIAEPVDLSNGLPSNQTVYWQVNQTGGSFTSGASGTNPQWSTIVGGLTRPDGQLVWLNLGSATYQSNHPYVAWTANGTVFSAIKDPNNNMQVCVVQGTTNGPGLAPGTTFTLSAASSASGNQTTYTGTFSPVLLAGYPVTISGFVNAGNNGSFQIVSCTATTLVVINSGGVAEAHAGTAAFNPWGAAYASQTKDGSVTWTCVGPSMSWVASTQWYLPPSGFFPPYGSVSYGGASIVDSNNNVEFVTSSGKSGTTQPAWPASGVVGTVTNDNAGGGTAVWTSTGAFSTQSLVWQKQYQYAYSYTARTPQDQYNTTAPPGWPGALGNPTGSQSGHISTASALTLTGGTTGNPGAVNVLTLTGSTDPQVDTITIWRTLDGGGTLFFLTEIPNPPPIGGQAQTVQFRDFQADSVINQFVTAPINHTNDPPPVGFIPNGLYHFNRVWGSIGNVVYCSGGPDTVTGNGAEAFPPNNKFTFPSPVVRLEPTATAILVFTTSDIYGILGGGGGSQGLGFTSFFPQRLVPGVGLLHYNAMDIHGGVVYMYTSDNQFLSLDPSGGANRLGGPIANKVAGFNASQVFVTVHESGNDNAVFLADGSTGWYRLNPSQFPNGNQVWSPFATITGGAGPVLSIEVSKGVHRLLVGGTGPNQPVLFRDLTSNQDNGTPYTCFFTMGNINLVNPGQIAGLTFVNIRATRVGTSPTVAFLLNEVAGSFTTFPSSQPYPWQAYGKTLQPSSLYSNAYNFRDSQVPALAEHLQVQVSFPAENFANEVLSLTVFGVVEQPPEM